MKIAWLNEHMLYWNGGIRYIYEVAKRIRGGTTNIMIVHLFSAEMSNSNRDLFHRSGVYTHEYGGPSANRLRYWLLYPYYIARNVHKLKKEIWWQQGFDAVISSSPTTHILAMLAGIKPILVVFELNPWLYSIEYQRGLSPLKRFIVKFWGPIAKYMEKKAYRNAVKIIAYSKFVQSEINRVYGVESEVVYTGIDDEFFRKVIELKEKYKGKQIILHVASYLSPMKGTDYAVESMRYIRQHVPNALLLILNPHNDVGRQRELLQKAEKGSIAFLTNAKEEELPLYYSLARVLLSPSLDENIHLPVLEAAACECPAIGFEGKMSSEEILDGVTGMLVRSRDIAALGAAVVFLLVDKEARDTMGKRARQFVMQSFSWEKCTKEYERIISEVIR